MRERSMQQSDRMKNSEQMMGKLQAMSGIIRLGHEAFQREGLSAVAAHIVNNSRSITAFDRSCLIDFRSPKPKIVAVSGQATVNPNSEYCESVKRFIKPFAKLKSPIEVNGESIDEHSGGSGCINAYNELREYSKSGILLIPLRRPGTAGNDELFIWMVEFVNAEGKSLNLLSLLAQHYAEAIWFSFAKKSVIHSAFKGRKLLSPLNVSLAILIGFVYSLFYCSVRQTTIASFEITSKDPKIVYAPYSGVINQAFFENGSTIPEGATAIEYKTDELNFAYQEAVNTYNRTKAELDSSIQKSLAGDEKELGREKLLRLMLEKEKLNIQKAQWYLSKSRVETKHDGIISIGGKEQLAGKAIRAGEKLFEIIDPQDLVAKVMVPEAESSVLNEMSELTLYLATKPDEAITGEILERSPKAEMTDSRQFCYNLKVKLDNSSSKYIYGMRGMARIKGKEVSFGYYLFRSTILWWRKI